jgi:hypothetical protein
MKKLLFIISIVTIISSCASTNETKSVRKEQRDENKLAELAMVKNAIESRRFIVKLNRIYMTGGIIDLRPRANYIIIDGRKAIINTAYIGRQWDIRRITAINMRGAANEYEMTSNLGKGKYEVSLKVQNGASSFDVYLTIGKDGNCNASVNSLKISNIRYSGFVVPIIDNKKMQPPEGESI